MSAFRTRIAPTPSGYLHIGNAFSFLLTALIAKKNSGQILLRIDDIDSDRKRPEYIEDIFTSLEWLGIEYQEGPTGPDDFEQNWSQHRRLNLYDAMLTDLRNSNQLFACQCSRKKLAALETTEYPGYCENLNLPFDGDEISWRIRVPKNLCMIHLTDDNLGEISIHLSRVSGSFTVRKKDKLPSYQLVSLADDTHFRINYIVRGEDLLGSTAAQLYLADSLEISSFRETHFYHHKLQRDTDGNKLSKSAGSVSLQYMRKHGMSRNEVYALFTEQMFGKVFDNIASFNDLFAAWMSIDN